MSKMIESLATSVVNILVMFFVLRLFVYKPVYTFLKAREGKVEKEVTEAHEMLSKASDAHRNIASDIEKAKSQAEAEYQKIVEEAKANAAQIVDSANAAADELLRATRENADAMRTKLIADAENEICELSVEIASRILAREISLDENRAMVEKYLKEVSLPDAAHAS